MLVHTAPLRVKTVGEGLAPTLAPTKPMLTELPPCGARLALLARFVTLTLRPFSVQLAAQWSVVTDSELAGNVKASVQPLTGSRWCW